MKGVSQLLKDHSESQSPFIAGWHSSPQKEKNISSLKGQRWAPKSDSQTKIIEGEPILISQVHDVSKKVFFPL